MIFPDQGRELKGQIPSLSSVTLKEKKKKKVINQSTSLQVKVIFFTLNPISMIMIIGSGNITMAAQAPTNDSDSLLADSSLPPRHCSRLKDLAQGSHGS
jgi:hypothetical protein